MAELPDARGTNVGAPGPTGYRGEGTLWPGLAQAVGGVGAIIEKVGEQRQLIEDSDTDAKAQGQYREALARALADPNRAGMTPQQHNEYVTTTQQDAESVYRDAISGIKHPRMLAQSRNNFARVTSAGRVQAMEVDFDHTHKFGVAKFKNDLDQNIEAGKKIPWTPPGEINDAMDTNRLERAQMIETAKAAGILPASVEVLVRDAEKKIQWGQYGNEINGADDKLRAAEEIILRDKTLTPEQHYTLRRMALTAEDLDDRISGKADELRTKERNEHNRQFTQGVGDAAAALAQDKNLDEIKAMRTRVVQAVGVSDAAKKAAVDAIDRHLEPDKPKTPEELADSKSRAATWGDGRDPDNPRVHLTPEQAQDGLDRDRADGTITDADWRAGYILGNNQKWLSTPAGDKKAEIGEEITLQFSNLPFRDPDTAKSVAAAAKAHLLGRLRDNPGMDVQAEVQRYVKGLNETNPDAFYSVDNETALDRQVRMTTGHQSYRAMVADLPNITDPEKLQAAESIVRAVQASTMFKEQQAKKKQQAEDVRTALAQPQPGTYARLQDYLMGLTDDKGRSVGYEPPTPEGLDSLIARRMELQATRKDPSYAVVPGAVGILDRDIADITRQIEAFRGPVPAAALDEYVQTEQWRQRYSKKDAEWKVRHKSEVDALDRRRNELLEDYPQLGGAQFDTEATPPPRPPGAGAPPAAGAAAPEPGTPLALIGAHEGGGSYTAPDGKDGEIGKYQMLPDTIRAVGFQPDELRNNPEKQELAALRHWNDIEAAFGASEEKTIVAWNRGIAAVQRAVEQAGPGGDWKALLTAGTNQNGVAFDSAQGYLDKVLKHRKRAKRGAQPKPHAAAKSDDPDPARGNEPSAASQSEGSVFDTWVDALVRMTEQASKMTTRGFHTPGGIDQAAGGALDMVGVVVGGAARKLRRDAPKLYKFLHKRWEIIQAEFAGARDMTRATANEGGGVVHGLTTSGEFDAKHRALLERLSGTPARADTHTGILIDPLAGATTTGHEMIHAALNLKGPTAFPNSKHLDTLYRAAIRNDPSLTLLHELGVPKEEVVVEWMARSMRAQK